MSESSTGGPENEAPEAPEVETEAPEPEAPEVEIAPDEVLLAARDQARAALAEITDPRTIGSDDGHEVHESHVLTLFFECRLPGYPGWRWAATLARIDEESAVNVLEVELLPGVGAVVAPEWVPWSVRLAQYRESQARQAAEEASISTRTGPRSANRVKIRMKTRPTRMRISPTTPTTPNSSTTSPKTPTI
jgi:hypothetical protein